MRAEPNKRIYALWITSLVLFAVAIFAYTYSNRYIVIAPTGEKEVLFDVWRNDLIHYVQKDNDGWWIRLNIREESVDRRTKKEKEEKTQSFLNLATPKSNTRKLYGRLLYLGVDCGTFEEMEEAIQRDERNRQMLYDKCVEKGINVGSYKQFKKSLGLP